MLLFNKICKKFNGTIYENFCFLHKKDLTKEDLTFLKKITSKIMRHKLFTEFKILNNNYSVIIINLNKLTYKIDDIIQELYLKKKNIMENLL